jgi:hypothetical protein
MTQSATGSRAGARYAGRARRQAVPVARALHGAAILSMHLEAWRSTSPGRENRIHKRLLRAD